MKQALQKGVGFFGRVVEKLVGQAQKAKGSLETKTGLQPLLSLESRLPLSKLKQIINFVGDRFILPAFANMRDKMVLEIGEGPLRFQKMIAEKKPKFSCGVFVDGGSANTPLSTSEFQVLKGSIKNIPFEDRFFDCVVGRLTTPYQGDVVSAFKEIGRVLVPGGAGFILDFHPFGLFAKSGAERLRSIQATIRGIEDYYKMARVAGLSITDLHEGFVDDTLRNQFVSAEELDAFREIKGTPLVLFLQVIKPRAGQ